MTRLILATLLVVWTCLATDAPAQKDKTSLSNDDVIAMLANGIPEDVVIGAISANDVNFDVSAAGLMGLKRAQVGDRVVQAMLAAEAKKRDAVAQQAAAASERSSLLMAQIEEIQNASQMPMIGSPFGGMGIPMMSAPGNQAPTQLPKVTLIVDDKRRPMDPSIVEVANGKGHGGSAAKGVAKGLGKTVLIVAQMTSPVPIPGAMIGRGGAGTQTIAHTWALPGLKSGFSISSPRPRFEIEFADIPGVDPDKYEPVIERLIQTKDNWRLVSSSKDKFDKHGNDTRSVKTEDKTPVVITELGRGHVVVMPTSELPPGEYGLVLHPTKSEKDYAGVSHSNADAIFSSVWDFSIAQAKP